MNIDTSEFQAIRTDAAAAMASVRDLAAILLASGTQLPPPKLTAIDGGRQPGGRHRKTKLEVVR